LVGDLVTRAGEEDAHVVPGRLARGRGLLELPGDLLELVHREDVEAALLTTGHDETAGELLAELRGEEETALVVEAGGVGPEEHHGHLPFDWSRMAPCASVIPHFTPPKL